MAELVTDCPRCGSRQTTFSLFGTNLIEGNPQTPRSFEAFCVCRHCDRGIIFILRIGRQDKSALIGQIPGGISAWQGSLAGIVSVDSHVGIKDMASIQIPEHLPPDIETAFQEGATCLAVKCANAAGTMFRLCVDMATQTLLPPEGEANGPNAKQRRDLGLRLPWLFESERLPKELADLSSCIKEDGNDAAHRGTLSMVDAEDMADFATALLERLYTEPKRLEIAAARRALRRTPKV